jgi:hypothetical protein
MKMLQKKRRILAWIFSKRTDLHKCLQIHELKTRIKNKRVKE